jgi:hypothetical protein
VALAPPVPALATIRPRRSSDDEDDGSCGVALRAGSMMKPVVLPRFSAAAAAAGRPRVGEAVEDADTENEMSGRHGGSVAGRRWPRRTAAIPITAVRAMAWNLVCGVESNKRSRSRSRVAFPRL